tara:strand:- start:23583 stop:24476 length:894 start_codon:yes stop_codon:yes gene_type:complete
MTKNKEKGFALILSIVLLIVMSLMGGSLIVISSGDHQSNNNSDQYQQTFYVAETGLMEGEKWILDNYLGHWMTSQPSDNAVLGDRPAEPGPAADWDVQKEIWDDKKTEYTSKKQDSYFRHTFARGPASNDTTVKRTSSKCLMSFKNLDTDEDDNIKIVGSGKLPVKKSFLDIVGPLLCDGPYSDCVAAGGESKLKTDDDVVINEEGSATKVRKKAVLSEFNFLKRFEYEYFIRNIGMAAYRDDGSSIATSASNVDSQGTAYKIYSCGIFYGIGGSGETHNGDIEILIPLENVIVMPS